MWLLSTGLVKHDPLLHAKIIIVLQSLRIIPINGPLENKIQIQTLMIEIFGQSVKIMRDTLHLTLLGAFGETDLDLENCSQTKWTVGCG